LLETKLPTVFTRISKGGSDGSLLKIKEKEELWVGSGYLSNERKTKGTNDLMSHKDVQLHSCFSF
jgi:hypothetical protein